MPVTTHHIRNNQDGPVVFSHGDGRGDYIEWQGRGDRNGEDVQEISDDTFSLPQFQKVLKRNVLEEISDPETITESENAQREHWEYRQSALNGKPSLERPADKDYVVLNCIGPGVRADHKCDEPVSMRSVDVVDRPPLCEKHKHLRHEFVPSMEYSGTKTNPTWLRASLGERVTEDR